MLYLTGTNSYTGGTVLTADATPGGVIVYSQASFVGPYTFAGNNSLGFGASMSATNAITFNSGVMGAIDTLGNMVVLSGLMSGGGTMNKIDSGTLMLAGSNSLSGAAAISQGTLQLANANAAANSTVSVNADNGLQFNPGIGAFNIGGLSGSGVLALSDTGGAAVNLSVGGNDQNTTYTGMIVGAGTLTKAGDGSLDLTGTNAWTGGLALDPGVVTFNSDSALGAPANRITFLGSGTLQAQCASLPVGKPDHYHQLRRDGHVRPGGKHASRRWPDRGRGHAGRCRQRHARAGQYQHVFRRHGRQQRRAGGCLNQRVAGRVYDGQGEPRQRGVADCGRRRSAAVDGGRSQPTPRRAQSLQRRRAASASMPAAAASTRIRSTTAESCSRSPAATAIRAPSR